MMCCTGLRNSPLRHFVKNDVAAINSTIQAIDPDLPLYEESDPCVKGGIKGGIKGGAICKEAHDAVKVSCPRGP